MYSTAQKALAEFVGTFALIFVGVGAIFVTTLDGSGANLTTVALGHGLAIAVMVSALAHVSGAHFNPAVTAAALATRKISVREGAVYLAAQLAGGTAAAAIAMAALPGGGDAVAGGTPVLNLDQISVGQGVLIEIVLTFFLVWVIFGTAMDPRGAFRQIAGMAIGFTVLLDITMGGPLTGAAMNPARAFGPALVSGTWDHHWVYWVAPVIGGLLAGLLYDLVILRGREEAGPGGAAAAADADG
ncbi:MAG TPA: MIP family channel protein [Egibacteraceae bacterium]|nr:MIP family channel protein [Egibacteraceae bacterium]